MRRLVPTAVVLVLAMLMLTTVAMAQPVAPTNTPGHLYAQTTDTAGMTDTMTMTDTAGMTGTMTDTAGMTGTMTDTAGATGTGTTTTGTQTGTAPSTLPTTGAEGFSLPLSMILLAVGLLLVLAAFARRPNLR